MTSAHVIVIKRFSMSDQFGTVYTHPAGHISPGMAYDGHQQDAGRWSGSRASHEDDAYSIQILNLPHTWAKRDQHAHTS